MTAIVETVTSEVRVLPLITSPVLGRMNGSTRACANGNDGPDQRVLVILPANAIPPGWESRASPMVLLGLLPDEAQALIAGGPVTSQLPPEDVALVRHAAAGRTAREIADALFITQRMVYRRLARLRQRYGVSSSAELASLLTGSGF